MTSQQDKYAKKRRDLQDYQKAVNKAASEAAKRIRETDPRYKEFVVIPMIIAHVRNPIGKNKALMRLLDLVIKDGECQKTNTELLAQVKKEFPTITLNANLWSQKRQGYFIKNVQKRINASMAHPISVQGCRSLSDVRQRFKVAYLGKSKTKSYTATFLISKETVVVNKKPYKLVEKSAKERIYKVIKFKKDNKTYEIRAAALLQLLRSSG